MTFYVAWNGKDYSIAMNWVGIGARPELLSRAFVSLFGARYFNAARDHRLSRVRPGGQVTRNHMALMKVPPVSQRLNAVCTRSCP